MWHKARALALSPIEYRSPLAGVPYDLRHAAVSTWLNAGVPATQVAEWAGHSVFCGRSSNVYSAQLPSDVCSYFSCIANFWNGKGYMEECNDGMYSMSGGIQGACSRHSGEQQAVLRG